MLRGALEDATYEPQYRRERNFVFDVYSYERFTQTFAVDIVTRYLAVLTLRDQLQNEAAKSRPRWPRS